MAGQLLNVEFLVEGFGRFIGAIEYDGNEGEGAASFVTVAQGLRKQSSSQALALLFAGNAEPGENRDWQQSPWQLLEFVGRQFAEIDLSSRQRVIAGDVPLVVEEHPSGRKPLLLVLQRILDQPIIDFRNATPELLSWMSALESFKSKAGGERDAVHALPRMMSASFRWAGDSTGTSLRAFQNASCSSAVRVMV